MKTWPRAIACVSMALAGWTIPTAVLADTTPSGTSVQGSRPLPVDPIEALWSTVQPVAIIGVIAVVLIAFALLLAKVGGRAQTASADAEDAPTDDAPTEDELTDDHEADDQPTGRVRVSTMIVLGICLAALALGFVIGRDIAIASNSGRLFGGAFEFGLTVFAEIGAAVIGVLALVIRRGRMTRAIGAWLAAAALLPVGGLVGHAAVPAVGGGYPIPVTQRASAQAHLALTTGGATFVPPATEIAKCTSLDDSDTVMLVQFLDLGTLSGGTVRGAIGLPESGAVDGDVNFYIDGADLAASAGQPTWSGHVQFASLTAGGGSGTARFDSLPWTDGAEKLDPGESLPTPPDTWPAALSGSLTWACDPWGTNR